MKVALPNLKTLFLENKTLKQTILKNTSWLAIGELISRGFTIILLIYAARILGATEYGKFTFAFSFVSLFVVFSDFGLISIITREFSQKKEKEKNLPDLLTLKILLSIAILILIYLSSFFFGSQSEIRTIILILAIYSLANHFLWPFFAFLRAREKMEYEALIKIITAIFLFGVGIWILFNFPTIQNLSYGYLATSFIVLILFLIFFHSKIFKLKLSFDFSVWKNYLSMAWPLALGSIFVIIYQQIDSVIMGSIGQITETGWYNAAYKIVQATFIPSGIIGISFFPVLSSAFEKNKEKFQKIWDYRLGINILIATPLVVGGVILASKIINFIYGPTFFPSILTLQILMVMIGFSYINGPLNQALIACHQQKKTFWILFGGATLNVILNLILIPKYSLYGASISILITMIFMSILSFIAVVKFTPLSPFNGRIFQYFLISLLSVFFMYLTVSHFLIYNFNIFLIILIGAVIYFLFFLIFNKVFKLHLI